MSEHERRFYDSCIPTGIAIYAFRSQTRHQRFAGGVTNDSEFGHRAVALVRLHDQLPISIGDGRHHRTLGIGGASRHGLLAPARFLPLIESHRLSVVVGEWVIRQALQQLANWQAAGLLVQISVNVSAMQLQQADFFERLQLLMAEFPTLPENSLQLEILETSALQDIEKVSQLIAQCAEIGVSFALDDFGTGYSSLTYLKRLPIPFVKIDQSFVREVLVDRDNRFILDGILWIMRQLQRDVIAEGVETLEHGRSLMDLGCEMAQGYGIARPMPVDDLPAWLERWRIDAEWTEVSKVPRTAV